MRSGSALAWGTPAGPGMPEPAPRNLLLEPDPRTLRALEALALQGAPGLAAAGAGTLREGLRIQRCAGADLAVLAVDLPDCPGLSALDRLLEAGRELPVILLGGAGDLPLLREGLHRGAQDWLLREELTPALLARALRQAHRASSLGARLRAAESARRAAEQLLAGALDALHAAVALTDESGILRAANALWKAQDASRNPLVPPWEDGRHDYRAFARSLAAAGGPAAEAAAGYLAVLEGEASRFARDLRWGEGAGLQGFSVTVFGIIAEGHRHVGVAVADITPRVRAEARLREMEALLERPGTPEA